MNYFGKILLAFVALMNVVALQAANTYDNPDTLFVARDGTAEFRNVAELFF